MLNVVIAEWYDPVWSGESCADTGASPPGSCTTDCDCPLCAPFCSPGDGSCQVTNTSGRVRVKKKICTKGLPLAVHSSSFLILIFLQCGSALEAGERTGGAGQTTRWRTGPPPPATTRPRTPAAPPAAGAAPRPNTAPVSHASTMEVTRI